MDSVIVGDLTSMVIEEDIVISSLQDKLELFHHELASSNISQLWFQYIEMVSIVCKSIKAQRTGNWLLHLEAVSEMLPFFAASGHYLYAKSAYLYLQ